MIKRLKPKSEFSRNVLTLMTGTTIAQAIPIAISPILTRMYTPEDFGVLAVFVAITSIFGSIANGRYELTIMLPEKDEDAINIFALGFIITSVISLILLVLVTIFHSDLEIILNNKSIGIWLYFIPVAVFFTGVYNILNYFNNRKKYYKDIAKATIIKSIITAVIQLSVGFLKGGVGGLIGGQVISQLFANMRLIRNVIKDKFLISNISKDKMMMLAKKYKDYPKFTLWAGLASTLSVHYTNILISSIFSVATLGFYSLVQKLLGVPSVLIGNSIGQVFFQEATKEKRLTGSSKKTFKATLQKLIIIGLPSFTILYFIVEELFAFVFGEEWRVAGIYAEAVIPLFFVMFVVSPFTIMNQVDLKNRLGMQWQFGLFLLYMSIMYAADYFGLLFIDVLNVMVVVISAYYLYFLFLINRHVKG